MFNFVVTPRNFIIAKLSIRKRGSSSVLHHFISTDEDPGLRIESFAIIKLRGVTTKLNIIIKQYTFLLALNLLKQFNYCTKVLSAFSKIQFFSVFSSLYSRLLHNYSFSIVYNMFILLEDLHAVGLNNLVNGSAAM